MTVGEKIKLLRENRKLSIAEVSKDSQINAKKLKRIEKNSYIPSREEVQKLCDVFEVEEKEIINEETRKDTTKYDALLKLYFDYLQYFFLYPLTVLVLKKIFHVHDRFHLTKLLY